MLEYLKKFHQLPFDIQSKISDKNMMRKISDLEKKYGVDLFPLIIKVIVFDIKLNDIKNVLEKEYGLNKKDLDGLRHDLINDVFIEVKDYLNISLGLTHDLNSGNDKKVVLKQNQKKDKKKDILASSKEINKKKKNFLKNKIAMNQDKGMVRKLKGYNHSHTNEKLDLIINKPKEIRKISQNIVTVGSVVDKVISTLGLKFESEDKEFRFKSIISIYFKGVRNRQDTKKTLMKKNDKGGLSIKEDFVERILEICDKYSKDEVKVDINDISLKQKASFFSNNSINKKNKITQNISDKKKLKPSLSITNFDQRDVDYDLSDIIKNKLNTKEKRENLSQNKSINNNKIIEKQKNDFKNEKKDMQELKDDKERGVLSKELKIKKENFLRHIFNTIFHKNVNKNIIKKDGNLKFDNQYMNNKKQSVSKENDVLKASKEKHDYLNTVKKSGLSKKEKDIIMEKQNNNRLNIKKQIYSSVDTKKEIESILSQDQDKIDEKQSLVHNNDLKRIDKEVSIQKDKSKLKKLDNDNMLLSSLEATEKKISEKDKNEDEIIFSHKLDIEKDDSLFKNQNTEEKRGKKDSIQNLNVNRKNNQVDLKNNEVFINKKDIKKRIDIDGEKKRIEDIKQKPRLLNPVSGLRYMDLLIFRRLSNRISERINKIENKINELGNVSFAKRLEGIAAWRESPVNKLYLKIGKEGIVYKKSIEDIINIREKESRDFLYLEEFNAIMDLNEKLRKY